MVRVGVGQEAARVTCAWCVCEVGAVTVSSGNGDGHIVEAVLELARRFDEPHGHLSRASGFTDITCE